MPMLRKKVGEIMKRLVRKCQEIMNCADMLDPEFDEMEECEYYTVHGYCCSPYFYFTDLEIEQWEDYCDSKDVLMSRALAEKLGQLEDKAEKQEQGCDLCANPRCDNCTNAGRFLICAYIKTGEICIQHHATNYCGNCGRKLVE